MNITTYEMNKILNHVFSGQSGGSLVYTSGSFYMGLSTTEIASDGTGATEPSTGYGYARQGIKSITTNWSEASLGGIVSLQDITFNATSGAWGTIRSVFLANEETATIPTSASICYYQNLATPFPVPASTTVTFASGSISVSIA